MKTKFILLLLIGTIACNCCQVFGQGQTKRVLFLGNSFSYYLPEMLEEIAASMGDTLIADSNREPGYSIKTHAGDSASLAKIAEGNWDFVVLQDQSQLPSFPIDQVETEVFPYARFLDSLIHVYSPCCETVFYMTWGWKNGDYTRCDSWPPVCTYEGMDSLLNLRYRMMADRNHAIVSPVGAVWHYIRQNSPSINLYYSDNLHPETEGLYAAGCTFYTTIFRRDPTLIPFSALRSEINTANILNAVKSVVYDSLMTWHIGEYDPLADFSYAESGANQISFTNSSENATTYLWSFGDGDTSSLVNPIHAYAATGTYSVTLTANQCERQDSLSLTVEVSTSGINQSLEDRHLAWSIYPNPVRSSLTIKSNFTGGLTYKIFNLTGAEIESGILNDSENQIAVSSLTDGLYFLQLFGNNKSLGLQKFFRTATGNNHR